jgi:hypothetical protein
MGCSKYQRDLSVEEAARLDNLKATPSSKAVLFYEKGSFIAISIKLDNAQTIGVGFFTGL